LSLDSSSLSFSTECILFLPIILVLCISFIAYIRCVFFNLTHHTLPNPPLPITYWQSKCSFFIYLGYNIYIFSPSYLACMLDRSILKQFFISLVDFFEIVELLRICYFCLFDKRSLVSFIYYLFVFRADITTPEVMFTLAFLY
jgi:hypothetical protein